MEVGVDMDIRIMPSKLSGKLNAPPSKSAAHRAAICAALSHGVNTLSPIQPTADMLATISAASVLGAKANLNSNTLEISGVEKAPDSAVLDCGESGSTLRFFVPIAAALGVNASFRGHGRLPERPMEELVRVLSKNGVIITKNEDEILSCSGKLKPGIFEIGGNVSSQYITGLLFALPLLDGDSSIKLTTPLESRGYVDMTIAMQSRFGVNITETFDGFFVKGNQQYKAQSCEVEGDYSSAAFWLTAAAIGGSIRLSGLDLNSKQGDKRILELLTGCGAKVEYGRSDISVEHGTLNGFDVDVSQIPDIMPILAVAATFSNGVSRLYNARRLRLKESDRLTAVTAGLRELGAGVIENADEITIIGQDWLRGGGIVDSYGDHRIAMSMSIATAFCRKPSVILGAECVDKSYPGFYKDFAGLGGVFDVL